jgi:beta-phosphoglucomutase family hydrolase
MTKLGALLFDLDGTIVDNMYAHLQAWVEYLGPFGVNDSDENVYKNVAGKTTQECIRTYFGNDLSDEQMLAHYNGKEEIYKKIYRPVMRGIPGVIDLFKQADRLQIPMAIASAAGIDNVEFILNNLSIGAYFKAVVSSRDVKKGKPDPEIFLLAASRLGVDPADCLVFEDSIFGLQGAFNAGMKAVAITTAHSEAELLKTPAVIKVVNNYLGFDLETLAQQVVVT